MTAEPKEFNLDELKRMLQRLDKRMQDSPPVPQDLQGIAPLIPTGREVTLTVQQVALSKAGIRDQGSASTTCARWFFRPRGQRDSFLGHLLARLRRDRDTTAPAHSENSGK